MSCIFTSTFPINGKVEFKSEEEFKEALKAEINEYKDSKNFRNSTLENVLLNIPDFTVKLKVDYNGNELHLNYNELVDFIEYNKESIYTAEEYASELHPEEVLQNILKGKHSDFHIVIPDVAVSYSKRFHGFTLEGLADDTIVEVLYKSGTSFSGPVSYVKKVVGDGAHMVSVMEREIVGERELKGYD